MAGKYRERLNTFDVGSLPDLDEVVLGALELFQEVPPPPLPKTFSHPLVVGSENAHVVGQLLYADADAHFANADTYREALEKHADIGAVVLVSASGGKSAVDIARTVKELGKPLWLITTNEHAPARVSVDENKVIVFPKNREPYTYNVSTYLGMILSETKEDPAQITSFIAERVEPLMRRFSGYTSFFLIVPSRFELMRSMFSTKFEELFGTEVVGQVFTSEEAKHAKTVVTSLQELFISFGEENTLFGEPEHRLHIPLPENALYGAMMAIGYFVVGHIQKSHPPYFKERLVAYTKEASQLFGHEITPIVE